MDICRLEQQHRQEIKAGDANDLHAGPTFMQFSCVFPRRSGKCKHQNFQRPKHDCKTHEQNKAKVKKSSSRVAQLVMHPFGDVTGIP